MKLHLPYAVIAVFGISTMMMAIADQGAENQATADKPSELEGGGTVEEQIKNAVKTFSEERNAFMKKLRAIKDRKKMMEMYHQERPKADKAVDLILGLANKDPKAKGVEYGLTWVVRIANMEQRKKACDLLLAHYSDSDALATAAQFYGRMPLGGEAELRKIIKQSGNQTIKQGATYYLGEKLLRNLETKPEGLALLKQLAATPGLEKSNPKLLERVRRKIMVAEKLGVGCIAPEIVGTDHAGEEFKLSEYRGKVVLLDFWGIW